MDTIDKAAFSLDRYRFDKAVLNLESIENSASFDVDFSPSGEYDKENKAYILNFTFKAFDTNKDTPFVMVECVATFKFQGVNDLEDVPNFFYSNSIAILFPYIRAFVSTLTLQANVKPILLPTLNLSSLQEILKRNTIVR